LTPFSFIWPSGNPPSCHISRASFGSVFFDPSEALFCFLLFSLKICPFQVRHPSHFLTSFPGASEGSVGSSNTGGRLFGPLFFFTQVSNGLPRWGLKEFFTSDCFSIPVDAARFKIKVTVFFFFLLVEKSYIRLYPTFSRFF